MAFAVGDPITSAWGNTVVVAGLASQYGRVLVAGFTAWSATTTVGVSTVVTFGVTFTSTPVVQISITVNSNKRWDCNLVGSPTFTDMTVRCQQIDSNNDSASGFIHWFAFGPL
jgi:hypothetical protein